ncbi:MAG TPA: SNF2-related protein [Verrucomicrobiae bacterium]|jgi:superfamily II DNA or RNA helicase
MIDLDSASFQALFNRVFDPETRAQGERLYRDGKVINFRCDGGGGHCEATAQVLGSAPQPHQVAFNCSQVSKSISIGGRCACPKKDNCQHIYAVFLVTRDHLASGGRQLPPVEPPEPVEAAPPVAPLPVEQPPLAAEPPPPARLSREWEQWLRSLDKGGRQRAPSKMAARRPDPLRRLLYVLKPSARSRGLAIEFLDAHFLPNGTVKSRRPIQLLSLLGPDSSGSATAQDRALLRRIFLEQAEGPSCGVELDGKAAGEMLAEIVGMGRCYWMNFQKNSRALSLGARRPAIPVWRTNENGWQEPALEVTPSAAVLTLAPLWYIDDNQACCGPLETSLSAEAAIAWLSAPALSPEDSSALSRALPERTQAAWPLPARIEIETEAPKPVPCLRLVTTVRPQLYTYFDESDPEPCHVAYLDFDYSGFRISFQCGDSVIENFAEGRLHRLARDVKAEQAAVKKLGKMGLASAEDIYFVRDEPDFVGALTFDEDAAWMEFVLHGVPELQASGWRIEVDSTFAFQLAQAEEWYADAQPGTGMDWFNAEIGVQVDGQKINLLPILLEHFARNQELFRPAVLEQLGEDGHVLVPLPDGRRLPFPAPRLKMMLGVLMDLFEPQALDGKGRLRMTRLRAAELSGATGEAAFRWLGGDSLRELNQKLRDFRSIRPVAPPPSLQASLRGYQQEGLNWLQFLREYNLAGILADDMGLGKTVQALAHLLEEKQSGRADRPSLVVAPTSLMTNWRQETERFAPGLKLLVLHGQERKQYFEKLKEYDLIITSYPLLPRDESFLVNESFHAVILDEAQYIKNPKTKYAQIVCQLRARHHVCLTGTPMENHLGELWSQFNFLLPGFLGNELQFRRLFRTPIEKGNDTSRRELLARRIGPFVLRRRKDDVAAELPPKTEIRQNVELAGAQRDLYETIRLAMHARVQEEVRNKGMSRAHIIILDALLKLRQVCCDPRLVKLEAARRVTESAKLELLMDLVPEMLAEGRKILLFSQFTSMLALIQAQLAEASIPHVILTGQTTDRATPVQQFQNGEAPLFLISLKAGGTGLNLTAADTVIHYDPWWNPAVETQATDRAHRIGQTKSVFVYKLMTVGTVEEKILALQDRKRGLVEGVLDAHRKDTPQLTADDLQVLFSPLSA